MAEAAQKVCVEETEQLIAYAFVVAFFCHCHLLVSAASPLWSPLSVNACK